MNRFKNFSIKTLPILLTTPIIIAISGLNIVSNSNLATNYEIKNNLYDEEGNEIKSIFEKEKYKYEVFKEALNLDYDDDEERALIPFHGFALESDQKNDDDVRIKYDTLKFKELVSGKKLFFDEEGKAKNKEIYDFFFKNLKFTQTPGQTPPPPTKIGQYYQKTYFTERQINSVETVLNLKNCKPANLKQWIQVKFKLDNKSKKVIIDSNNSWLNFTIVINDLSLFDKEISTKISGSKPSKVFIPLSFYIKEAEVKKTAFHTFLEEKIFSKIELLDIDIAKLGKSNIQDNKDIELKEDTYVSILLKKFQDLTNIKIKLFIASHDVSKSHTERLIKGEKITLGYKVSENGVYWEKINYTKEFKVGN